MLSVVLASVDINIAINSPEGKVFLEEIAALLENDRRPKQAADNGLIKAVVKRSSPNTDDRHFRAVSAESAAAA